MADQTTNYVIQVNDGIATSIQPRLQAIGSAAISAGSGCNSLQQSLDKLNASGITSATQAMRAANSAQQSLSTGANTYARAASAAAVITNTFAGVLPKLAAAAAMCAAQIGLLTGATQGYVGAARAVITTSNAAASAQNALGQSAGIAGGGVRGMAATIGIAEGRITSANRLASTFLATLIGSGPIVQAAFSVLGALALLAVLGQIAQAVYHVVEAYKGMQLASRQASDQAILDGERVLKVKGSLFSATTVANMFNGSDIIPKDVTVQNAETAIKEAQATNQIAAARRADNEAGLTGAALQRQRQTDIKEEITNMTALRDAMNGRTDAYRKQLEGTHAVDTTLSSASGSRDTFTPSSKQVLNITDATQVTAIQKQMKTTADETKRLNTEISVLGYNLDAAGKKEAVDNVKDALKAARLEMAGLNVAFKEYEGLLTHKMTPQEGLNWWEGAEAKLKYYSANIDNVNSKEEPYKQQVQGQNNTVKGKNDNLDDQISSIGAYNDALKEKQELDKLTLEFSRQDIALSAQEIQMFKDKIAVVVEAADYQKALNSEYEAANGPLDRYTAAQQALSQLMIDDPAHAAQYAAQLNIATRSYQDAINPLNEYAHSLQMQAALLGQYGTALSVATQLQQINQTLRAKGLALNAQETASVTTLLTHLEQQRQIQADVAAMYAQNAGAMERLTVAQLANNAALAQGVITQSQYRVGVRQNAIALDELLNARGIGTFQSHVTEVFASVTKGYTTFSAGAQKALNGFYTTLTDGFANTVGHVIAYGGNMGKALEDVARQDVGSLISSFVKLGIQWATTAVIGATLGAAATTTASAQATAVAAAWSPAAAFASLATLGANSIPADAALASTTALAAGLSLARFAGGGPVSGAGTGTSDSIPARLSHGEYVVNAQATSRNYAVLDAINNNRPLAKYASGGYVAGAQLASQSVGNGGGTRFIIEDHTAGVKWQQVPVGQDEMRLIARDESKKAVYQHGDKAAQQAVANPNSATSKQLRQSTNLVRRRVG